MLTTSIQKRYCTIYIFEQKRHFFFFKIVLGMSALNCIYDNK